LLVANVSGAILYLSTRDADRVLRTRFKNASLNPERLKQAKKQLEEYFAGQRKTFDVELDLIGTVFQKRVWKALLDIPFGETRTYASLAKQSNVPSARAVGRANATNPVSIIVPCHRVIGTNGTLTGYAGGLEAKSWLLKHEGAKLRPVVKVDKEKVKTKVRADLVGVV
jgi:methylated-DNA-[protein]-cysteine S-methyltransferase